MTPGWKCPRRIGFLFPHPCQRLTPEGCPDCQNGQVADPYRARPRYYYTDYYDDYDYSLTGLALGSLANHMDRPDDVGDPGFTEADGESLVTPDDNFESDMSAS